jgi:GT2 family glycosyltransferase
MIDHPNITSPTVSVIILNWNGLPDVFHCLECVLQQTYPKIELFVVDNASTDRSIEYLTKECPDIRYIRHSTNLGFARGMNAGIKASTGKYVIPLNQDAFLDKAFVSELVSVLETDFSLGAGSPVVQVVGRQENLLGDVDPLYIEIGYLLRKQMRGIVAPRTQNPQYVFGPSGSCPFFRREMLEDVALSPGQYYDESYVTGGEDIELYFRMQLRGWRCLHVPKASCIHIGSGSVDGKLRMVEKPLWYQRNMLRNRYFTIIADIPGRALVKLLPYLLITDSGLVPYFLIRSPKTFFALAWAWLETVKSLPRLLRKRHLLQSRRTVSAEYIMSFFIRF